MTLVADENIPTEFITSLRTIGFDVLSIRESYRSHQDRDILDIVRRHKAILLTEDKDFGEWVFAHGVKDIDIIFLRYEKSERSTVFKSLTKTLERWTDEPTHCFITITGKKIRRRTL